MSNQANSIANDLMVGAGTLYFERFDDTHGLHHLGNVDEFNITTDVTTVEKNSSMNRHRDLMASVVTAVTPTATLTLTEYNPYNLALGLFGTENVHHQDASAIVNQGYTITSVPGVLELTDGTGERYFNLSDLVLGISTPVPAKFQWKNISTSNYIVSTTTVDNDTITDQHTVPVPEKFVFNTSSFSPSDYTYTGTGDIITITDADSSNGGGTITLSPTGLTSTTSDDVLIEITQGNTSAGSLSGLEVEVTINAGTPVTFNTFSGLTDSITLANGCTVTFTITATTGFVPVASGVEAVATPATIRNSGGVLTLSAGTFSGTTDDPVYVSIPHGTNNVGDLAGLELHVVEGMFGGVQSFTATGGSVTEIFTLASGATITATVSATTSIATNANMIDAELSAAITEYVAGKDYIVDEHMLRGGLIQIPATSRIKPEERVMISAKVPEGDFVTVSGANAGEINGRLLFIGDPNIGGQYTIEAWKVKVQPDGDFTGLIGTDFGSFNLTIKFMADYENHPNYPYYRATLNGRADGKSAVSGIYDPNY